MLVIFFEGYSLTDTSQRKPELLKSKLLGQDFFRTGRAVVCCLLLMLLVGSRSRPVSKNRAQSLPSEQAESPRQVEIKDILERGKSLFVEGRYAAAAEKFAAARRLAAEAKEPRLEAHALANLGGCAYATHRHEEALSTYQDAHRLALSAADKSTAAVLEANISSLYAQMGELDAAVAWKERALTGISGKEAREHLAEVEIELASLRARQNRLPEAYTLFGSGIDRAQRAHDPNLVATAWSRLGEDLLRNGGPVQAERALLEAYRLRRLNRRPSDSSYAALGQVHLAAGDYEFAAWLFDRAVALSAGGRGATMGWQAYHLRARARMATGRLQEALEDLRIALPLARAWRWSGNRTTRAMAEGIVEPVSADLIDAGNRLYLKTHDPKLIAETFEAAEESRDSSLRALLNNTSSVERALPEEYWETVARLQRAEVAALRASPGAQTLVRNARAEMVRMEASWLPDPPPQYRVVLGGVQRALPADAALLSYHLGDTVSWLWAVDRGGITLSSLAPRSAIEQQVRAAVKAIREDTPDRKEVSARLYTTLFGALPPRFAGRQRWLVALEGDLLLVPIAALLDGRGANARYVVERHTVSIIPGAAHWLDSAIAPAPRLAPVFVGVGDPIYNTADPRIANSTKPPDGSRTSPMMLQAAPPTSIPLQLPRLVASSDEVDACIRAWRGPHVALIGAEASRRNVTKQLLRGPAVVHFATHVLASHGGSEHGVIVLGLSDRGETEVLSPLEIARWRIRTGVVVLSGCESATESTVSRRPAPAAYDKLPGAGWMGLTRAWLAAGAESVVATRWTMPDVDGSLFSAFYSQLSSRASDAAAGLRAAQLEMLHSGGWRAQPRYWGAYFAMGNR